MTIYPAEPEPTNEPIPVWRALFIGGPHHEKGTLISARLLDQPLWFEGFPEGHYCYVQQARTAIEGHILLIFKWHQDPNAPTPPYDIRPLPRSIV
jgi:hypothetical protein